MSWNFMRIEDVVMSGDGFSSSMAYHAFLNLSLTSFVAQCVYCICAIALGYWLTPQVCQRLLQRWPQGVWRASFVRNKGPSALASALMACFMAVGWMVGWPSYELLVVWKVLALTLWVMAVRGGSWVFRRVMHPQGLLRFFLWLIEWSIVLTLVLTFFGLFQPMVQWIDGIEFTVGMQVFKGENIVVGLAIAVVAFAVAGQLSQVVEWGLLKYSNAKQIQSNDALILTRLFGVGIFGLTALGVLVGSGIETTTLAAFAGALGIGLGFGLQQVMINFFSGLYILFERAMKVGDYVTINQVTGQVVQLSSRAIVVRDAVGTESLIPNSSLNTHILQNHTLSNDDFRVSFTLRLAHIADYPQAKALILQEMAVHSRVLQNQPQGVLVAELTADEVRLDVSCWINDLHNGQKALVSDLLYAIGMAFAERGVALAHPRPAYSGA